MIRWRNRRQLITADRTTVSSQCHRVRAGQRRTLMLMTNDRSQNTFAMMTFADLAEQKNKRISEGENCLGPSAYIPMFTGPILDIIEDTNGDCGRRRKTEGTTLTFFQHGIRAGQLLITLVGETFDLSAAVARTQTRSTIVFLPNFTGLFDQTVAQQTNVIGRVADIFHQGRRRTNRTA